MRSQPDPVERAWDLAVLHEPAPDVAGTHVLRAQQNDARVDSDHVCIRPTGIRIEGVYETILSVDRAAPAFMHRAQRGGC